MGPSRTLSFFLKKEKYQGTAFFFLGIVAILARWTIVGFILECYGLVRLFADFLGTILGFIGMVPVVGPVVERWGRRVTGMLCYSGGRFGWVRGAGGGRGTSG